MNYPISTYRVQLNSNFTFNDLASIIDYLEILGITTIYASPITTAVKNSNHGYDVTDPGSINPDIGTVKELSHLSNMLKDRNMTWLQDIVPNHMAFSCENSRLMDVLERGMDSPYHTFFDIDWNHALAPGKIIIPDLEDDLTVCIEQKEIKIRYTRLGFRVVYKDRNYPLSVSALSALSHLMEKQNVPVVLIHKIQTLASQAENVDMKEWTVRKETFIEHLFSEYVWVLETFLDEINNEADIVKTILHKQFYLFIPSKSANVGLNYRRFLAVNSLISLKMEDERVFNDYHTLLLELYYENIIQGFRLDHIDGLYNPLQYIQRLKMGADKHCYIIAEKILAADEPLPKNWPIQGTSGYEFLADANKVLTDKKGSEAIVDFYKDFTGNYEDFPEMVYGKKLTFLYSHMQGELNNLITLLEKLLLIQHANENTPLREALGIMMAAFPVYRLYPEQFPLSENDKKMVHYTFEFAVLKAPHLKKEFKILENIFEETTPETTAHKLIFIKRLMQFTGPLAAKGVEDTAFYVYNPLISHNEVGDAPSSLGSTVEEFHRQMLRRLKNTPYSLSTTATHDTKRGEDARIRINVLAHVPGEWKKNVLAWHQINASHIQEVKKRSAPSLNDEYLIYQSLIGSFPETLIVDDLFLARSSDFLRKALREANEETSYDNPDNEYEDACIQFLELILIPESSFLKMFIPFQTKIMQYAAIYSLAQTVIKTTAPGIPDFYQGSELNDISYVDSDNRGQVDYDSRMNILHKILQKGKIGGLLEYLKVNRHRGVEKMFVTRQMLLLRKKYPAVFLQGDYVPLTIHESMLSYIRQFGNTFILVLIPLDFDKEGNAAHDIVSPLLDGLPAKWINVFTEEVVYIQNGTMPSVFSEFPMAVFKNIE